MATLICRADQIRFTILEWQDDNLHDLLIKSPDDCILGYVTRQRKFRYTESGKSIEVDDHWTVDILKESLYVENKGPWIVYTCCPEETKDRFAIYDHNPDQGVCLTINNWDIWSVKGKQSKVAVVTSSEIF